jgi:hypothetical protein
MTPERPKHHGGQRKPAAQRKRNNMTFRARDQLKADLEKAAEASNRSVSEEIEFRLGQAFQWERVLGDLQSFKARLADMERQTVAASMHRKGYGKLYTPDGPVWFEPGMHNIPQSGFIPDEPVAPPDIRAALIESLKEAPLDLRAVVREVLKEAGLLEQKKKPDAA